MGTAYAHETLVPHSHPHPAGSVDSDGSFGILLISAILLYAGLRYYWVSRFGR